MADPQPVLSPADLSFFHRNHYLILDDCFSRETADDWTDTALRRCNIDRNDLTTWPPGYLALNKVTNERRSMPLREFAPHAWSAACQLVGGAERIAGDVDIVDAMNLNTGHLADQPWQHPSQSRHSWHVDGDYNHFLDSPESGLMLLLNFTDVHERGGATWIAPDGVEPISRVLLDHPEGLSACVLNRDFDHRAQCQHFMSASGPAGRIFLMHPLMLHAVGPNPERRLRAIRNRSIPLTTPMRFDGSRPLSPVEAITVDLLGDDIQRFVAPDDDLRHPTDHDTGARMPRKTAPAMAPA